VGVNFIDGLRNLVEDWGREVQHLEPFGADRFRVGHEVAATAGQVAYRNALIELIQYAPTTEMVRPEPILIVPAWIMKFYILDLSPENSLVRYLVGQGFTVFMISWKNPGEADRDLGLDDYRTLGPMAALDLNAKIAPGQKVHAVGYCLGGTLMSIAAAAMARDRDDRCELRIFINESQLAFLDDLMWEQGYLKASQMAGAFQMLRSNDLVWCASRSCWRVCRAASAAISIAVAASRVLWQRDRRSGRRRRVRRPGPIVRPQHRCIVWRRTEDAAWRSRKFGR